MAANPRKDTIKGQVAIAKEIVKYGMEHGYPGLARSRWAVKAAWIETKLEQRGTTRARRRASTDTWRTRLNGATRTDTARATPTR